MSRSDERNISERKRMEEELGRYPENLQQLLKERSAKLAESEEKYRSVTESIPVAVWTADQEGNTVFITPNAQRVYGYSPEQIYGDQYTYWWKRIHPEDVERVKSAFNALFTDGRAFDVEYRFQHLDGRWVWLHDQADKIHERNGVKYTDGVTSDITERKRIEEELRSAREMMDRAVSSNPAVIHIAKPHPDLSDYSATYMSKSIVSLIGFQPEELIGESGSRFWETRVPPDDLQKFKAEMPALWRDEHHVFEYRFLHKDGKYRWIHEEEKVIRDGEDRVSDVVGYWTDVTERIRLEEALRESETRYRRLFESSPISLWEEDFSEVKKHFDDLRSKGIKDFREYFVEHPEDLASCASMVKILNVNKSTLDLYGMKSVEEVRGELSRIFTHQYQDRFIEELVTLAEGKTRFESEFDNQTLTGDTKHVSLILTVVPGYEDTLAKVLVSIIDLTSQKQMQQQLRSANRRLEHVIESNPAVIYIAQPLPDYSDYASTYQSNSTLSLTGFESEEFIGEKGSAFWASRVHPDDLATYQAGTAEFWQQGRRACEYRFLNKNGTYRWIREESKIIRDSTGNIRDIIGYWTDVTELKRIEEELQAAKMRLEYVVASNPATIYSGKPLPDCSDWYLTYLSDRVTEMLGFEPHEFINDHTFANSRVHPDDMHSVPATFQQFFKEGHATFDYRFLHKDGKYRWIREEARLVRDENGKPVEVNGYWIDITELKEMEHRLQQAERLAAVGETAAMVGHDLRNPLQGIAGAVHLLQRESLTANERDKILRLIQDCVDYSDGIVRDLTEYAAEIHLDMTETTPKLVVREALGRVTVPHTVTVHDASQHYPAMKVDSDRITRVIVNLVENAIQAMPQGGTLTISSKQAETTVEIVFSDTGVGVPEKIMQNLWKPLQTTKAKGMGLGLAICKRFVDAHGGDLSVKSKVGEGTTFTIRLPINPTPIEVRQK